MNSTIEYGQFRGFLATIHFKAAGMSPRIIAMVPDLRQKMAAFKAQNRNLYFQFVNQVAKEDAWMNNGIFEELKELVRSEDPEALQLYTSIKRDFLAAGLAKPTKDESLGISTFNWPMPTLEGLAKCISFDLSREDYEMLNQVLELLMGNVEMEQQAALYVLKAYTNYAKSLQMNDRLKNQIIRRAFALMHPDYPQEVKLRSANFFNEIGEIGAIDAIESCLSNDEIQQLFERHLPLITLSTWAVRSIAKLKDLFYERVPGFIRRILQTFIKHQNGEEVHYRDFKNVVYTLVELEHKRKLAIEEFEDYEIPHSIVFHNELASSIDVVSENLQEIYDSQMGMDQRDGLQKAYSIQKIEDLGSLLDLPVDLTKIRSEMQLHLYAGIKRDFTANYDNLIRIMDKNLSADTKDYFITQDAFDRFQVPSAIIERKIEEALQQNLTDHSKASRAILYCPTSVNLNANVRTKLHEIRASRQQESLVYNERIQELRLAVEIIELTRIFGLKSTEVDSTLQQYLPLFTVLSNGSNVDEVLHKHFHVLLQMCQGLISETTAEQYLRVLLVGKFAKFISGSVTAAEFCVLVNAVTSLGSEEANSLVHRISSGLRSSSMFSHWSIENSFELLHLIGQRSNQVKIADLQEMFKDTSNKKFYNLVNAFSGFIHLIGSQEYIELVISIIKQHSHTDDDVQLEFILRGLNNLFVAHKKQSCAELFAAKLESLLNLIEPAFTDPSNETLIAFLYFIRNVLQACPDVTSVLQNHVTVSRAMERALSPNTLNLTVRDYANQISAALKSQAK